MTRERTAAPAPNKRDVNDKYIKLAEFTDGHRYWIHRESGRVAVSDQSGYLPHQTDDGLMFVDFTRTPSFDSSAKSGVRIFVPVIMPDGEKSNTYAAGAEAMFIQGVFAGKAFAQVDARTEQTADHQPGAGPGR